MSTRNPTAPAPGLLSVDNLSVDFSTPAGPLFAVRGISFDLYPGEILGIVGESGSGKSVTAHSIMRLLPQNGKISGGSIRYRGEEVAAFEGGRLQAFRGGDVAMIFQEPGRSFDPIYSIGKALAETIRAHQPDLDEEAVRDKSIRLLREANVPEPERRLDNFPHQFSGGLLQRIMIALALASDPKILIADEPTTALDVTIQAGIIDLLLRLKKDRGLSIIFITHNLALISNIADRIVVMYAGLIMESGPADQVISSPRHPYTRALLDSLLGLGQHYTRDVLPTIAGSVPNPFHPEPGCPFAPRCPLVRPECRGEVPPLVTEETAYRCVVTGVKEPAGGAGGAQSGDPQSGGADA
jgi:oligopeptide/dipeptide ABC transporter ATP-binding protein